MGTTKARRRERYAQDPDYRAKQRAYCRAYYRARKQEINERNRAYYHAHKQDIKPILRRGQLKRLYGISPADYDALLAKQDGVCATCGKPSKETLCVDHCHTTGTIRGLLCRKCNTGLGCYEDDPATMISSLAYLGCGCRDGAGAAAKRALAARAVLPPGRAGVTVRVEARSHDRLDAGAAPASDRAMRPMWNGAPWPRACARSFAGCWPCRLAAFAVVAFAPELSIERRSRLRTSRREGHASMARSVNGGTDKICRDGTMLSAGGIEAANAAASGSNLQRPPFGRTKHCTVPAST